MLDGLRCGEISLRRFLQTGEQSARSIIIAARQRASDRRHGFEGGKEERRGTRSSIRDPRRHEDAIVLVTRIGSNWIETLRWPSSCAARRWRPASISMSTTCAEDATARPRARRRVTIGSVEPSALFAVITAHPRVVSISVSTGLPESRRGRAETCRATRHRSCARSRVSHRSRCHGRRAAGFNLA